MPSTFEKMTIILDEKPKVIDVEIANIDEIRQAQVDEIIKRGLAAKQLEQAKAEKKAAKQRQMEQVVIALLRSPDGLTKAEILGETESDNFISALGQIRGYLKHDNLYTLIKKRKAKVTRYLLDPVR